MDKVDKLIIKAKKTAQRKAERFFRGFVEHDPDMDGPGPAMRRQD